VRGFAYTPLLLLGQTIPSVCVFALLRPPIARNGYGGTGISTCCPSTTPFGLALGPDLPWADEPSPGTLRLSADQILTDLFVTHTGILTCMQSTVPSGTTSTRIQRSPTQDT
jgi:hypothetical protein